MGYVYYCLAALDNFVFGIRMQFISKSHILKFSELILTHFADWCFMFNFPVYLKKFYRTFQQNEYTIWQKKSLLDNFMSQQLTLQLMNQEKKNVIFRKMMFSFLLHPYPLYNFIHPTWYLVLYLTPSKIFLSL